MGRAGTIERTIGLLLLSLLLLVGASLRHMSEASAYEPPQIRGHVNDQAGVLSPDQVRRLEAELSELRRVDRYHVVVLIVPGLDGEPIEDVAYDSFNTWGIGDADLDNGVLLVLAVAEQRVRIETGKGVGGELTDIESGRIIREQIKPRVAEGKWYEAASVGTQAIAEALTGRAQPRGPPPLGPEPTPELTLLHKILIGVGVLVIIVLAIVFPGFRRVLFWVLFVLARSRGGGGGGGGGYGGGGGRSGGGGASG